MRPLGQGDEPWRLLRQGLPAGVVSVDLQWDAPDEAGVLADILATAELADIVDVGGVLGKSGLDEQATDTRMKDLGKISCRSGGNHHHWLMGVCLDCDKTRRKFMEEFKERQRQRERKRRQSLRGST